VVILRYSNDYPALLAIDAGLTWSLTITNNQRIYRFTAGTGTVTF
jgi:hypothetical protein